MRHDIKQVDLVDVDTISVVDDRVLVPNMIEICGSVAGQYFKVLANFMQYGAYKHMEYVCCKIIDVVPPVGDEIMCYFLCQVVCGRDFTFMCGLRYGDIIKVEYFNVYQIHTTEWEKG